MMKMIAHNPDAAKRVGMSQAAAKEYVSGQSPTGLPERKTLKSAAKKVAKGKG